MSGRGDPPEGTPEGAPGGGEDEYRSMVFDESFIRAARLQENSADERLGEHHAPAVRPRRPWTRLPGSRQALLLVLLIVIAFGTAIYMGVRHPYKTADPGPGAQPLRSSVVPLTPPGAVPGGAPGDLFAHSPAAHFKTGAAGITIPSNASRTAHFSGGQVIEALRLAKEYLIRSSVDPATLTGGNVRSVRLLLDTGQLDQFDRSMARPVDDGRHAATGWLVRLDRSTTALADRNVRVSGTLATSESGPDSLEVTADYTFVYAVRATGGAAQHAEHGTGKPVPGASSLFTVRREIHFRLDREDLADHRLEVAQSTLQAGPMTCSPQADVLRPLLAGQRAGDARPAGTDPYSRQWANPSLCGRLAATSQPAPSHPIR